jgi:hypothetical protein
MLNTDFTDQEAACFRFFYGFSARLWFKIIYSICLDAGNSTKKFDQIMRVLSF